MCSPGPTDEGRRELERATLEGIEGGTKRLADADPVSLDRGMPERTLECERASLQQAEGGNLWGRERAGIMFAFWVKRA